MQKILQLLFLCSSLLLINGCSDDNTPTVVVYTSVDQVFSQPILKDFERETGVKVKAIYDTEETKSTGVLNRLIAEKHNAQCDLFWSGDPIRTIILKSRGITYPHLPVNGTGISPLFTDSKHHWYGFSARARVLIYNKSLLAEANVPHSILDLDKEQYKGQVAIANPLFGTTTFHIAALFSVLGDKKAKQFLKALKNNKIVIATSNGDVKKRVMKGEVACGITDTDDAYEAMQERSDIGMVFLDQELNQMGSLIIPNTVNLIKNAPHLEQGRKLMDYLLSPETEAKLAISCAQMPLHKGVKIPQGMQSLDRIHPMNIDYSKTAQKSEEIQNYLKAWVEN